VNLDDAMTCLWLTKSHWSNFNVLSGEKLALQAGAWLDVLGDVDLADVRAALAELDVEGLEFAPTPGQVRQTILRRRGELAPDTDQALTEVLDKYRRGYDYTTGRPDQVSHPAIDEAMRTLGGWRQAGQMPTDELRRQFRYAYEPAAKRADREASAPPAAPTGIDRSAEVLALPTPERPTLPRHYEEA
jgi:hypothetical protein